MAITWRNVNQPSFGAAATLAKSGTEAMNTAFSNMQKTVQGFADRDKAVKDQEYSDNTKLFQSQMMNAKSPEERELVQAQIAESGKKYDPLALEKTLIDTFNNGQKNKQDALTYKNNQLKQQELQFGIDNQQSVFDLDQDKSQAQINSSNASTAASNARAGEIYRKQKQEQTINEARIQSTTYDENGKPQFDNVKFAALTTKAGINPTKIGTNIDAVENFTGKTAADKAAGKAEERAYKKGVETLKAQGRIDTAKVKTKPARDAAALESLTGQLDKDVSLFQGLFGEDTQFNEAKASIASAIDLGVPNTIIDQAIKSNQDYGGDVNQSGYNNAINRWIKNNSSKK